MQKKLDQFDLELAQRSEAATDQKAIDTKLKEKERDVSDMSNRPTERLTKFVDLVNKNHIAPITENSKQGDREFYAEAYSLCLVDPEFMQNNYRVIFDFFRGPSPEYRK